MVINFLPPSACSTWIQHPSLPFLVSDYLYFHYFVLRPSQSIWWGDGQFRMLVSVCNIIFMPIPVPCSSHHLFLTYCSQPWYMSSMDCNHSEVCLSQRGLPQPQYSKSHIFYTMEHHLPWVHLQLYPQQNPLPHLLHIISPNVSPHTSSHVTPFLCVLLCLLSCLLVPPPVCPLASALVPHNRSLVSPTTVTFFPKHAYAELPPAPLSGSRFGW